MNKNMYDISPKKQSLFFLTNTPNLATFLSSQYIGPFEMFKSLNQVYNPDLLKISKGYIPFTRNGCSQSLQEEVIAKKNKETTYSSVLIKIKSNKLFSDDSEIDKKQIIFHEGILPISCIDSVIFETDNDKQDFIDRYLRTFSAIENYDKKINFLVDKKRFNKRGLTLKNYKEEIKKIKKSKFIIPFNEIDRSLGGMLILGQRMNEISYSHEIPNLSNLIMSNFMLVKNELWMPWDSLNIFEINGSQTFGNTETILFSVIVSVLKKHDIRENFNQREIISEVLIEIEKLKTLAEPIKRRINIELAEINSYIEGKVLANKLGKHSGVPFSINALGIALLRQSAENILDDVELESVTESIKVMSLMFIGILNGATRISNKYKKNNIDLLLSDICFMWVREYNIDSNTNAFEISPETFKMTEVLNDNGKYFSFE